jgi:hypothetical protein
MQVGAVLLFDAGPLQLRHGGVDFERVRAYTQKRLPELPRARQRRVPVALGALETFADDPSFELEYHVRHVSLPKPGDERALKRLAARVFSQALDPEKPLWELWLVEGLEGGRFALLAKCDSALLEDGAGAGLLGAGAEILGRVAGAARSALGQAFASVTPAPYRRIEWLALRAEDLAAIRERLGGTERDAVLAALAGGLRRACERRGAFANPGTLHAVTPICVQGRVTAPRFRLPVEIADPRARFVSVRAACERQPSGGAEASHSPLHELAELAGFAAGADLALFELAPLSAPARLLGAELQAVVPIAPRLGNQSLGVTVTRLGERVFVGLACDSARLPDLAALTDGAAAAFDELRRLAEASPPASPKRARPRRRRSSHKPLPLEAR